MPFLYFIPNCKFANSQILRDHGLDSLLRKPLTRETAAGPEGKSGLLLKQAELGADLNASGDIKWHPRHGSNTYLAIDPKSPPTPTDLARDALLPGIKLRLGDGHEYTIPQLRSFDPDQLDGPFGYACNLDRELTQDEHTGDLVPGSVVAEYRDVWETASTIGDNLLQQLTAPGKSAANMRDAEIYQFAAQILGLNYRLQAPEIAHSKLLRTNTAIQIMHIAIDWETLRQNLGNRLRRANLLGPPATASATNTPNTESGATPPTEASPIPTAQPSPS